MPKKSHFPSDAEALKERVVDAWLEAAPRFQGCQPKNVEVLKNRGHSFAYRLVGADIQGTNVVAKHCTVDSAEMESTVYQEIFASLPAPALRFYGWFKDAGEYCWLFIEDAGDERYSGSERHRSLAGSWLGILHYRSACLSPPTRLPKRGPEWYLAKLRSLRASLEECFSNPALTDDDLRILEGSIECCDALDSHWDEIDSRCNRLPETLIHGDLSPKNTRIRMDTVFAIDWETASWGVPAIDLASLSPDLDHYSFAIEPLADAKAVGRAAVAGRIFHSIVAMGWEAQSLSSEWPGRAVRRIALYRERLTDLIQSSTWRA